MAAVNQVLTLGDWLAFEEDNRYARDSITVLAGSGSDRVLTTGMVLGKVTASGKYKQIDFAGADGTETAAGVLIEDVTAPDGTDIRGAACTRGPATAKDVGLVWPAGATTNQKNTAIASLKTLGIIVRQAV